MKLTEKLLIEFYKLLYKSTHTKKYHHNRKRWPYIKIKRNSSHEITHLLYKKQIVPLINPENIKNKYTGSILLTATGPSVNHIKFNTPPPIPAMGVNGSYFLKSYVDFSFYVVTDIHFPEHQPDIIKKVVFDSNIIFFTTIDIIMKILERFSIKEIKCSFIIIEDLGDRVYEKIKKPSEIISLYKKENHFHYDKKNEIGFVSDIKDGIFPGKTVIYWALQIISHLGFDTIYIIGMDMNNFNKPRFYETEKDKIHTQLDQDMVSIISSLEHASHVLKNKLNINVINLSKNSSVSEDIFYKSEYKNHFD
ncbi:sugar glycosyltransferase [Brenneria roseae subsp. roseae]|uniref:sugar glycosyltransferase n=1 Tax=Brenneria roseae TaxID=1509241 RepID=UPI000D609CAD|nr:sugar glycosyltransferase [Brenneria roseae]PWC19852.1 sugar glycosyltransferase [Brenneria roseae subsp. roseae]